MLPFVLQISLTVVTKSVVVALVGSQTEEEGRGHDRLPGSLVRKWRKQEEGISPLMAEEDIKALCQCRKPQGWTEAFCSFQGAGKGRGEVGLGVINSQLLATDSAEVPCHGLELEQAFEIFIWLLIPHFLHIWRA